jgi:hypothetical protein
MEEIYFNRSFFKYLIFDFFNINFDHLYYLNIILNKMWSKLTLKKSNIKYLMKTKVVYVNDFF